MYTIEMFAFSCTVVSAGHSSYLGSRCRNKVVPISSSLSPSLSCPNSTSQWLTPPVPWSHPLSLFSSSPPKPPPSSTSTLHLLFPFHSLHLTHAPISNLAPTHCLSQGGKHNHLFICFPFTVQSIFTGKCQVANKEEVLGYMV